MKCRSHRWQTTLNSWTELTAIGQKKEKKKTRQHCKKQENTDIINTNNSCEAVPQCLASPSSV